MTESEEELMSLLMRVKEKSERAGLKLNKESKTMASAPLLTANRREKVKVVTELLFLGSESLQMVTAAVKSREIASWEESNDKPRQCVEKQRYYSADKGSYSQGYSLPSGHVWW